MVWEEAFGWADREARRPATAHTPYSLASISKPMTATGLMTLVEDGVLSGALWGHVPTPDVMRHPRHRLQLELLVRDGRMRGQVTAVTTTDPIHYALSSYLELASAPP